MNKTYKIPLNIIIYILFALLILISIYIYLSSNKSGLTEVVNNTEIPDSQINITATSSGELDISTSNTTQDYDYWVNRAKDYIGKNEYEKAISALNVATTKDKTKEYPYIERGDIYVKLYSYDKAFFEYQVLLAKDPTNENYKSKIVELRLHQVDSLDSAQLVDAKERLKKLADNQESPLFLKCLVYSFENNKDLVNNYCTKFIDLFPKSGKAIIAGEFIDEYTTFSTFQDSNSYYLETLQAKTISKAGFYNLAISKLEYVVSKARNYRDAWVLLGYDYLNINNPVLALSALDTAYVLDSTKPYIQYLLALTYDRLDNDKKAIAYYTIALNNSYEKKNEIRQRLAELYIKNKQYLEALKYYEEIILNEKVTSADFYIQPMWLYIEGLKDYPKAIILGEKVVKDFPNSAMSHNLLGWAYLVSNNLDKSKFHLEESIKLDPNLSAAYFNIGKLYEQKKDVDLAKKFFYKAYQLGKGTTIGGMAATKYNMIVKN